MRLVFLKHVGNVTIEETAVRKMRELQVGRKAHAERGVLLLYDVAGKRLRVEVGYGLEEYLPDGFVGYLMHDHARTYFESGDLSVGLRLTLRILQHRIRAAVLGERFDPTVLAIIRKAEQLSGGAGASAQMALDRNQHSYFRTPLDAATRAQLVAQATPKQTYQCYLEWLSGGRFDPDVALFTEETRRYLAAFPMSKAYFDHILFVEFGKAFKVDVRGDLALLYFTNDPFAGPHFVRLRGDRWYMDLNAEVQNTVNRTGEVYTWDYHGRMDDFSKVFADKFVDIGGYVRVADDDNRQLPTRKTRVATR